MKNMDDFCYAKEAIMYNCQIDTFCCQQRWIDIKEDTGKSMKNVLYKPKGTSWAEELLNSEKNHPQPLLNYVSLKASVK